MCYILYGCECVFCPLVVRFGVFWLVIVCCFVFYWFLVILFDVWGEWVQCTGWMHVFWIKAPQWCAWRREEKKKKKAAVSEMIGQRQIACTLNPLKKWKTSVFWAGEVWHGFSLMIGKCLCTASTVGQFLFLHDLHCDNIYIWPSWGVFFVRKTE